VIGGKRITLLNLSGHDTMEYRIRFTAGNAP